MSVNSTLVRVGGNISHLDPRHFTRDVQPSAKNYFESFQKGLSLPSKSFDFWYFQIIWNQNLILNELNRSHTEQYLIPDKILFNQDSGSLCHVKNDYDNIPLILITLSRIMQRAAWYPTERLVLKVLYENFHENHSLFIKKHVRSWPKCLIFVNQTIFRN